MCCIALGGRIGFYSGDPLRLIEDCQCLKPEFFPGVPRVLNRVYQAAMAAANVPGIRGNIFRKAYQAKLEKFRATGDNTHFFWDKLVFRKVCKTKTFLNSCSTYPSDSDPSCSWWENPSHRVWVRSHQPRCHRFFKHRIWMLCLRRFGLLFRRLSSLTLFSFMQGRIPYTGMRTFLTLVRYGLTETSAVGSKV